MSRRLPGSTFSRLFWSILVLLAAVIGPLAGVALNHYRTSLLGHYQREMETVAAGLATAAFQPVAVRDLISLQEVVNEVVRQTPADAAAIVRPDGKVLADSEPDRVGHPFPVLEFEEDFVAHLAPVSAVPDGSEPLAWARVGISRERLEREITPQQQAFAIFFLVGLAVAALLAALLSSVISQPLRRLMQAARTIAGGNLEEPVPTVGGPLEARLLQETLEESRRSLRDHLLKLEEQRRQLDRKVHDLTVLYNVSEAMNASDYSEGMVDTILGEAVTGVAARAGAIWLAEPEREAGLRLVASRGIDRRRPDEPLRKAMEEAGRDSLARGHTVVNRPAGEGLAPAVIAVPLMLAEREGGTLVVARTGASFSPEDRALAEVLGSQAARCVERAQLYAASITDGLTGLHVSRFFRMRLGEEVRGALRYGRTLSLLMIDIDHFKRVNDSYGHPAGDEVLRQVARCLLESVRAEVDIAARYGGEEFAAILPETDREGARVFAERLRTQIEGMAIFTGQQTIRVTVSIGLASLPADGQSPEALVQLADSALYRAKTSGRNRVEAAGGPGSH